jgi:hypothetical protein
MGVVGGEQMESLRMNISYPCELVPAESKTRRAERASPRRRRRGTGYGAVAPSAFLASHIRTVSGTTVPEQDDKGERLA